MTDAVYHPTTPQLAAWRKELAQLIAVAVAHVTQCPYCIKGHTQLAHRKGASSAEIMEAIWVAAEMRAGGAYAHSTLALHTLDRETPAAAESATAHTSSAPRP